MSYNNKTSKLGEIVPKVFERLGRYIDQVELSRIMDDYRLCCELGGNHEPGMQREEGVSFNPRLARILLLLVADGGVRDSKVFRAALYAAALCVSKLPERSLWQQAQKISVELAAEVQAALRSTPSTSTAALIRGVIELDAVRHIHQTTLASREREAILMLAEETLKQIVRAQAPEWICTKLGHAIVLQRSVY